MPPKHRHKHHRLEHVRRFRSAIAGIVGHAWAGLAPADGSGPAAQAPVLVLRVARRPDVAAWLSARVTAADAVCRCGWGFATDVSPPNAALHVEAGGPAPCSFILVFHSDAELRAILDSGRIVLKAGPDQPGTQLTVPTDGLAAFLAGLAEPPEADSTAATERPSGS